MGREKEGRCKKLQETENADSLIHSRNFQSQLSFYVRGKAFGSRPIKSKRHSLRLIWVLYLYQKFLIERKIK